MEAIILDGHLKSALSVVRSLGKKGIHVSVGSERKSALACHSRYATARFLYSSPYTDRAGFVRAVKAEAVRIGGKPVVYPLSDATTLALFDAQKELEEYLTLVFSKRESVEIAFDKAATYSLARISNVPTITTYQPVTTEELTRLAGKLVYPAVVKPRRSVTKHGDTYVFGTARFVIDAAELITTYKTVTETLGESPLIQERVVGEEYGVEMITHEGVPLASVVHHRIRSLSPTGGASVLKEIEPEGALRSMLVTYAEKLALALSWEGPIMVEFKVDSDTRTPKLMEVNGRFWGSLPLSVAAGVDMPHLYYLLASGAELPKELITAREGVVTRHFLGDMMNLIRVWFSRDPMRAYAYPKRLQALKDFLKTPKGTKGDIWSWKDPKPAFFEVFDMMKKYLWK